MSRRDDEWLEDIIEAAVAIKSHLQRGTLSDGLVFDDVRLLEIGEASQADQPGRAGRRAGDPLEDVAGMRDRLAHRYFDTSHAIVQATVDRDLPEVEAGVLRLRSRRGT